MKDGHAMKRFALALSAAVVMLGACEGRNPTPALEAPPVEAAPAETQPAEAETPLPVDGLEFLDGENVISALDAGPQDDVSGLSPPKFALHCDAAAKTLEIVAPARQLGDYAVAGPAQFIASGEVFGGEAVLTEVDGAAVSLTLPLTPELLAAIATTTTARLAIGDGFGESNVDINGTFPGFAGQCSLESGVPFPPR
jgi:hypothetical protein